jgi:hypothetical protein
LLAVLAKVAWLADTALVTEPNNREAVSAYEEEAGVKFNELAVKDKSAVVAVPAVNENEALVALLALNAAIAAEDVIA